MIHKTNQEVAATEASIKEIRAEEEELARQLKKKAEALWKTRDKLDILVKAAVLNRGIPPAIAAARSELVGKIKLAESGSDQEIQKLTKAFQSRCNHVLVVETLSPDSGNPMICEDDGAPGYRICLVCNLGEWSYADEMGAFRILSNNPENRIVASGKHLEKTKIITGKAKRGYESRYEIVPWLPLDEIIECMAVAIVGQKIIE
jgi:hypothetical protein